MCCVNDGQNGSLAVVDFTEEEKTAIVVLNQMLLSRLRMIVAKLEFYVACVELNSETLASKGLDVEEARTFISQGLLDHVHLVKQKEGEPRYIDFSRMIRFLYKQGYITRRTFDESMWKEMEKVYGRVKVVKHMVYM